MTTNKLHVAVIMDGNGRWAAGQGLPRIAGHYAGAEALRSVIESAPDCGIGTLTAYGFSSDNWKRPGEEVCALMELIAGYLESETERFTAAGVRLSVIGRRDRLPERLLAAIAYSEGKTSGGQGLHFQLAIDYSARETMLRAARDARFEENAGTKPASGFTDPHRRRATPERFSPCGSALTQNYCLPGACGRNSTAWNCAGP